MIQRPSNTILLSLFLVLALGCGEYGDVKQKASSFYIYGKTVQSDQIQPPVAYENVPYQSIGVSSPRLIKQKYSKNRLPETEKIIVKSASKKPSSNFKPTPPDIYSFTSEPIPKKKPRTTICQSATQDNKGFSVMYDVRDGVPTSHNYRLREDSKGAIWGCSRYGGIWQFDGYSFDQYNDENGLIDNAVVDFWIDRDDDVWIGGSTGLSIYDGQSFTHLTGNNEVSTLKPTKFAEDSHGNVWVGSLEGLYSVNKETKQIKHFTIKNGLLSDEVSALLIDDQGTLWITYNGIGITKMYLSDMVNGVPKIRHYRFGDNLKLHDVQCMLLGSRSDIFIGTDRALYIIDNGTQSVRDHLNIQLYSNNDIGIGFIYAIEEDKDGKIWIANNKELKHIWRDYPGTNYFIENVNDETAALSDSPCLSLLSDIDGNIWIGQESQTLMMVAQHSEIEGYLDDYEMPFHIRSMVTDIYGNIWFINNNDGLYCYTLDDKSGNKRALWQYDMASNAVQLVRDSNGNIWFGEQSKLYKINPGTGGQLDEAIVYGTNNIWPIKQISHLEVDVEDNIWISSHSIKYYDKIIKTNGGGAYKFDGNNLYEYKQSQGLIFDETQAIHTEEDGQVWFKSYGRGIARYLPSRNGSIGQWTHYSVDERKFGALYQGINFSNIVWGSWQNKPAYITTDSMFPDRLEVEVLPFLPEHNGQDRARVHQSAPGAFWITSNVGLEYINKNNQRNAPSLERLALSTFNGYPLNLGGNLAIWENGKIWCPTHGNIYSVTIDSISFLSKEKNITHFAVYQDDQLINANKDITLKYDDNYLRFEYNVTATTDRQNISYRYQLEGFDESQSRPSSETKAIYPNLPHGSYVFKVQAKVGTNDWGPLYQQSVSIAPPWWLSSWAFLGYGILIIAVLYGLWRIKVHQIHQQNQIEKEKTAADHLRHMDEVKTDFFTNLSHEFRTPLTVILGMSDEIVEPNKAKRLITQSTSNLLRLVNQMLDFSKMEAGKLSLNMQSGDFISFARYICTSFESLAEYKQIKLSFLCDMDRLIFDFDEDKVQHILTNIIANAIKFTANEGKVKVEVIHKADSVFIHVTDTGIGISEEDLPFIFKRYFQVGSSISKGTPGTGIGLSFAKDLVELMDGHISVNSTVGKGTEVTIKIPTTGLNADSVASNLSEIPPVVTVDSSRTTTDNSHNKEVPSAIDKPILLLVEDNPEIVGYITHLLSSQYDLRVAENGQIGINKAIEIIPDIIISDVMMPIADGYQLTDTLKNDIRTSHIPIILLTAKADQSSRIEGFKNKADAYLAKPFDKAELLLRLDNMIMLRKNIKARYQNEEADYILVDRHPVMEDAFIKKVNELLTANIENPNFVVDELARELHMSRSQLYRKIKALTDKTAVAYIRSYRLREAKRLLLMGDLNISQIAYKVGFSDPGYFTKAFSKEFGMLPTSMINR